MMSLLVAATLMVHVLYPTAVRRTAEWKIIVKEVQTANNVVRAGGGDGRERGEQRPGHAGGGGDIGGFYGGGSVDARRADGADDRHARGGSWCFRTRF